MKDKDIRTGPGVSIIIPVYNAEKTLERCVDSILSQDFRDLELLLIDDGSRDGSPDICDRYAERDSRVRVFHKENGGVSRARNLGLSEAGGRYIQFVDSDDWIAHDATAELFSAAESQDCDMVICDFYRVVGKRVQQKGNIDEETAFSRQVYAEYMMENPADFYYGVLWNKLFRRDIIDRYELRMNEEVSWCEDFMFVLDYLVHAETFLAVQKPLYYYVKTKGSLVSQGMSLARVVRMKTEVFEYYNRFYKDVFSEEEYQKARLRVYGFLIDSAGDGFSPIGSSRKLGDDKEVLCGELLHGSSIYAACYRYGKLFEKLTETARIRYDVDMDELKLLLCLDSLKDTYTRAELSDMTGLGLAGLTRCLTTLSLKKLLRSKDVLPSDRDYSMFGPRALRFDWLPASEPLMEELHAAEAKLRAVCSLDMSEDEKQSLAALMEKVDKASAGWLENTRKSINA